MYEIKYNNRKSIVDFTNFLRCLLIFFFTFIN